MIVLNDVTYTFGGKRKALDGISAKIGPGIHLMMGANGAGKTTLLHVIAGLRRPKTGQCLIDDENVAARQPHALSRIFMLDENPQWPARTIAHLVRSHARFYPNFSFDLLMANLNEVGLDINQRLDTLSLGNKKRASIAYALSLKTEVLLLDEPANGLDIDGRAAFQRLLVRSVDEQQTAIISTHTVWDVQNMVDGVIIINNGRISLNRKVDDILSRIAFIRNAAFQPEAIFSEDGLGGFSAIIHNDGSLDTDIDFTLLYKAMHDPQSLPQLLNALAQSSPCQL